MGHSGRLYLVLGGMASLGIAALHVIIVIIGPPGYRFFGAAELAPLAEQGSPVPALVTLGIAVMFAIWSACAFSGAGVIRRLPLLRAGLIGIGGVYALRGLFLLPELVLLIQGTLDPPREAIFSAGSLAIGLLYLIGATMQWHQISSGA
jgi:hypothetical protein